MKREERRKERGWCPPRVWQGKRERWFRGGKKRAWCHAFVCIPMWHDLEEMGQRQKNGGIK
jgi:hypothetical protein